MKKIKVSKCLTYEDAKKVAKELFQNNVSVYIYKITILNDCEHPYYLVSADNNVVISDDRIVELIKTLNPYNKE